MPVQADQPQCAALEAELARSARGRAFLADYARRCRRAEIDGLMVALERLHPAAPPLRIDSTTTARLSGVAARLEAMAWRLREQAFDARHCAFLDACAAEIQAAYSDLTGPVVLGDQGSEERLVNITTG